MILQARQACPLVVARRLSHGLQTAVRSARSVVEAERWHGVVHRAVAVPVCSDGRSQTSRRRQRPRAATLIAAVAAEVLSLAWEAHSVAHT